MDKGALRIAAIPLSRAAEGNDGSDVGLLELQFNALVRPAALVAPRSRFEVRLAGRWNHGLAIRELQQNREYHVLTRQNVTLHHQKPISSHVPVPVFPMSGATKPVRGLVEETPHSRHSRCL